MENQLIAQIGAIGVDTQGSLRRFCGNEALYERFLSKFGQDQSFQMINDARASQDWEKMKNAAHTLKGIAGNLGMNRLYQACTAMVQLLREQGWQDEMRLDGCFDELQQAYQQVIGALTLK